MTATIATPLSINNRRTILGNVLAVLEKRFYRAEKLDSEWKSAVESHRLRIGAAETADGFEQAVSDLLAKVQTSHLGFFMVVRVELRVRLRSVQLILPTKQNSESAGYSRTSTQEVLHLSPASYRETFSSA